jgi:hypothetical protein
MNEKQQFLAILNTAKKKLYLKHIWQYSQLGFLIAASTMLLVLVLARFVVVTHLVEKLVIIGLVVLFVVALYAFIKRPTDYDAAHYFDQFVADERVKTALQFLQKEDMVIILQRNDAISHMKQHIPVLKATKQKLFYWNRLAIIGVIGLTIMVGFLFPTDSMKLAQERETEEKIVKEAKEDIEKLASEEKKDTVKDLKEETDKLKESEDLLKKLLQEETALEKDKQEALNNEQLLKELAKESPSFDKLAEALEQADSEKLNRAMKEIMEKEISTLSNEQKQALENLLSKILNEDVQELTELTDEQMQELLAKLEGELENLMASVNSLGELANLQQQIQDIASQLHANMSKSGLSPSTELAFGTPNSQNNPSQNSGQNGGTNNGSGQSPGEGNGNSGNGNGNGSGSGSGSGTGSGSGSGTGSGNGGNGGSGSGAGSGAGLGQGSRELTIPERIDSENTIENDLGELGKGSSELQTTPDGLVLKGSVRSYEEVYGDYADSYRKSMERMQLPTYLEDVVKDYFSDLNPRGE